jgi:hypothetical protein
MPEVGYSMVVAAPVERVWDYVENLHNWCELMVGYQALDIVDDRRSIWTLRGDVGILSREVKVQVDITEWLPLERVTFVVTGITERLEGAGAFILQRVGPDEPAASLDSEAPAVENSTTGEPQKKDSLLRRARFALVRRILRRVGRKALRNRQSAQAASPSKTAVINATAAAPSVDTSAARSRFEFQLRVSPSGPMAPMIEVLMAPMLEPAAIDLADGIRKAVEG